MPVLRQQRLLELQPAWGASAAAQSWALCTGALALSCSLQNMPKVSPRLEEKHFEARWRFLATFRRLPLRATGHSEPDFTHCSSGLFSCC